MNSLTITVADRETLCRVESPGVRRTRPKSYVDCVSFIGWGPTIGFVRICSYCPDKDAATAFAIEDGQKPTHGACQKCYQREMAKLMGEPFED